MSIGPPSLPAAPAASAARFARALAERGAAVAVADINLEGAEEVAAALVQGGAKAEAIACDVSPARNRLRRWSHGRWRRSARSTSWCTGAGVGVERSFLDTSPEEWQRILDIDLSGTFFCGQAAARHMVERGYGRIVNLASTAGVRGGTGRAAYGTAKGGVIALTKVMAVELAPHGITVNALAPGAIETELVAKMHSAETRTVYRAGIPLDRYGTPEETAAAALFLASEEARYVTGHVLAVDGGFLAAGVMHRR